MNKSMNSEAPARDVYPTLNYFRTEDNIGKPAFMVILCVRGFQEEIDKDPSTD